MKNRFQLRAILCLSAISLLLVWGCENPADENGDSGTAPVSFTVTFNSNGGSDVAPITVNQGELITEPTAPEKTDSSYSGGDIQLLFTGWFTDTALSNGWDFSSDQISEDLELHAGWSIIGGTGPGNGIIFYDDSLGFNFGEEEFSKDLMTDKRFLEAAPAGWNGSTTEPIALWGDKGTDIDNLENLPDLNGDPPGTFFDNILDETLPNFLKNHIGNGASNTSTIVSHMNSKAISGTAAQVCDSYEEGNGFNDWFLPSIGEMALLYKQRDLVGGFSDVAAYWSSSECIYPDEACYIPFSNDPVIVTIMDRNAEKVDEEDGNQFRPVRAF